MKKSISIGILFVGLALAEDSLSLPGKDVEFTSSRPHNTPILSTAILAEEKALVVRRGAVVENEKTPRSLSTSQVLKAKLGPSNLRNQTSSLPTLSNGEPVATVLKPQPKSIALASAKKQVKTSDLSSQTVAPDGVISKKQPLIPGSIKSTGQRGKFGQSLADKGSNANMVSSSKYGLPGKQGILQAGTFGSTPSILLHGKKQSSSLLKTLSRGSGRAQVGSAIIKPPQNRYSSMRQEDQKGLRQNSNVNDRDLGMLYAKNVMPQRVAGQFKNSKGTLMQLGNNSKNSGTINTAKGRKTGIQGKGMVSKKLCKRADNCGTSNEPDSPQTGHRSHGQNYPETQMTTIPEQSSSRNPTQNENPNQNPNQNRNQNYFAAPEYQEMRRRHKEEIAQEHKSQTTMTDINIGLATGAAGTGPSAGLIMLCCGAKATTATACIGAWTCPHIAAAIMGGSAIGLAASASIVNCVKRRHDSRCRENAARREEEEKKYHEDHVSNVGTAVAGLGNAVGQVQNQVGGIQSDLQNVVGEINPDDPSIAQKIQILETEGEKARARLKALEDIMKSRSA